MLREMSTLAQALSEDTRLRILKLLAQRDMCVCELEEVLGMQQSRISMNLAVLRNVGLVTDRREGRWVFYHLNRDVLVGGLARLQEFLTEAGLAQISEMAAEERRYQQLLLSPRVTCPVWEGTTEQQGPPTSTVQQGAQEIVKCP
ncbi:MAG: winged helix-turn-helix transcriptional regulator [Chloroflexi bacterium]|nr:winged helix-turn-helix transcriptional regulator [Chloroflexota bacterium]